MAALKQLLALRLLQSGSAEQGCSKLVMNAAMFSTRSAAPAATEAVQGVAAAEVKVAQYSVSEAAAMASKKQHLTGVGSLSIKPARSLATFASSKAFSTSASSSAAVAASEPVKQKTSVFSRLAKAAAAVAAAVGLALGSGAAADAPVPWQWNFQDSATSTAQAMQDLHHDIMFFVISVATLVLYMTFMIMTKFHYAKAGPIAEKITHHTTLEVAWTVFPTLVVLLIGIPSLTLIYSMDQHVDRPGLTVKIIGRQWYWSYEMHDHLQHKLVDPDRLVNIAEKSLRA